jgi:hypothetical protein
MFKPIVVKESKNSKFYIEKKYDLHFIKVGYISFKIILPFLVS